VRPGRTILVRPQCVKTVDVVLHDLNKGNDIGGEHGKGEKPVAKGESGGFTSTAYQSTCTTSGGGFEGKSKGTEHGGRVCGGGKKPTLMP